MLRWITIHRPIINHWIFSDAIYFKAWVQILFNVNFKDNKTLIKGEIIECKRGQNVFSIKTWAYEFGTNWTEKKVRTFFKLLENDDMIKLEGLKYTTRLTVINYEKYQLKGTLK